MFYTPDYFSTELVVVIHLYFYINTGQEFTAHRGGVRRLLTLLKPNKQKEMRTNFDLV